MSYFLKSSVGKKIIMSLAGSFLMVFLVVHLGLNLLLLVNDEGELFNKAAHFMGTNPVVKVMQFFLFATILLHAIYGVVLQIQNWMARPSRYEVSSNSQESFFSKYMIHTAVIISIFIGMHMVHFFFKAESNVLQPITYENDETYKDWATLVGTMFKITPLVITYIISFIILGFHLHHAFQSAFQTIGLNNEKWMPLLKKLTALYSIIISAGFILITVLMYLK